MALISRLREIGSGDSGAVQLHGRLFAQWMHHAFPRECAYPHVSGTTNPLTPDELEAMGEETMASEEEMQTCLEQAQNQTEEFSADSLLWSPEEELLTVRPVRMEPAGSNTVVLGMCNILLFSAIATVVWSMMHATSVDPYATSSVSAEKYSV